MPCSRSRFDDYNITKNCRLQILVNDGGNPVWVKTLIYVSRERTRAHVVSKADDYKTATVVGEGGYMSGQVRPVCVICQIDIAFEFRGKGLFGRVYKVLQIQVGNHSFLSPTNRLLLGNHKWYVSCVIRQKWAMTKPLPRLFYKYTTRETARIVLGNGTLRWSTPALFNDPYDVQFDLHVDADRGEVRARGLDKLWLAWRDGAAYKPHPRNPLGSLIFIALQSGIKFDREQLEVEFGSAIEEGFDSAMLSLPGLHAQFRAQLSKTKILCQSEVADSLLMWAYYAEQHKGAVLCFSGRDGSDNPWKLARPVQYRRDMPRLGDVEFLSDMSAGLAMLDVRTLVDAVVYTKALEWAHEREWRLDAADGRHPDASYEDVPFHERELEAVIFGCLMPASDRDALAAIVRSRYPHARLQAARKDGRQFRLIIEDLAP